MAALPRPESLRVLCIDGGGVKGYTSLLILKRVFRTMMAEAGLTEMPKPCDVFDLIIGTSTGGLIAVMLGRLRMTIDECLAKYEQVGKVVFGKKPRGGKFGKVMKGLTSSAFYDVGLLQQEIKVLLKAKEIGEETPFKEPNVASCKVLLCVTRTEINRPDVLRSYESLHPTAENYSCSIWEAASATAAAPLFFQAVQFHKTGEQWCDGGLRRNNPINEALAELQRESIWKDRKIGCILSLGTGIKKTDKISKSVTSVVKAAIAIMSDSEDIAEVFASSELGIELFRTHRYFRFNLPQGMDDIQLDEWKETERMKALTTDYLKHASNGDLLERCAKSLLDPDENFQIDIKIKVSLIPYRPCTNFIDRELYSKTLLNYFRSKTNGPQTFVLWGLGGVGKTQVALKFAQEVKHRFSVFWTRADSFSNFATDYAQVFREIDPKSAESKHSSTDLVAVLEGARRKLEDSQNEWLLILDNTDDLDVFLGSGASQHLIDDLSISRFLPRYGRMLITTRDRRLQGTIGAANDGIRVDSMTSEESRDLLLRSIPGYLMKEGSETISQAQDLVEELGFLPLAIAQAAANILEQQLTLNEYVSFYHDKKQRLSLMQAPARDFQTTDPRNASQSVNITWQISFDVLQNRYPLSAVFLTYIGCFHWRNIPRILLRHLPEFSNLSEAEFIQLSKKPSNLSLLDEEEIDAGYVEYAVHPLVHDNIVARLDASKLSIYLRNLADLVVPIFPFVEDRNESSWNMASYMAPHAGRLIELADIAILSSKMLALLALRMSQLSKVSRMFNHAVDMAERARKWGLQEWDSDPEWKLTFSEHLSVQYQHAAKNHEAETMIRELLDSLQSPAVTSLMDTARIEARRIRLQSALATSLLSRQESAEREALHRQQLATGLINEWDAEGINIRHNLAHALCHQQKFEEANLINTSLLEFAVTEEGKKEVSVRLYTIMLNLRCLILRMKGRHNPSSDKDTYGRTCTLPHEQEQIKEELVYTYRLVFKISAEHFGIDDLDTWKAANNFTGCLQSYASPPMWIECGQVLRWVFSQGMKAKVKAEGNFKITLSNVTDNGRTYLDHLSTSHGKLIEDDKQYRELFDEWLALSGCQALSPSAQSLNNRGAHYQLAGMFKEAEQLHAMSIEVEKREKPGRKEGVYYYNLMLAIGRQDGRLEEAIIFRERHWSTIAPQEEAVGSLEGRVEQDRADRRIYSEAQELIGKGQLKRGDAWWTSNIKGLDRAEWKYGILEPRIPQKAHKGIAKKGSIFKLALRPRSRE